MPQRPEFLGGGEYKSEDDHLRDVEREHYVDVRHVFQMDQNPQILDASAKGRHHYQKDVRDQPPGIFLDLVSMENAFDHGIAERDHHHDLDRSNTKKEPWSEGSESFRFGKNSVGRNNFPLQHVQSRQTNATGQKNADYTECAVTFDLSVCN